MSVIHTTIDIAAAPERVWDVLMDPRRLDEWVTIHRRLEGYSEVPLERGSTIDQTLALAGAPFKVHWEVVELDACRRAVWEGRGPARSHASIRYELRPDGDHGTRFDYVNEFKAPGGPVGAVASRVLVNGISEREANRSLARLKALLEKR